jgi:hypothetical protein
MELERRFAELAGAFAGLPGVTSPDGSRGSRFGASALKVNGSIFAMLTGGGLVVKLPRDRVTGYIENGTGLPFHSGKGIPMREWLTVVGDDQQSWLALAREALDFVRSGKAT